MFWNRYSFFHGREDVMFYVFIIIPIFLISILVSLILRRIYKKYSSIITKNQISGAVVARNILDGYGLYNVRVEPINGELSDHFDPVSNVVKLSYLNYKGSSISSIGVAAHEVGHAIQHKQKYLPIKVRTLAIGVTNFSQKVFSPLYFLGLALANTKLLFFGLIMFFTISFFEFITLPVEFNASARAVKILKDKKILTDQEIKGVKKILFAAAMTYVVSFANSLAQLIRVFLIISSRNREDD